MTLGIVQIRSEAAIGAAGPGVTRAGCCDIAPLPPAGPGFPTRGRHFRGPRPPAGRTPAGHSPSHYNQARRCPGRPRPDGATVVVPDTASKPS
ncbi:hypothetical protein Adi01nite_16440 [Amorphoplanes digitatis]|nr:hypothetical protein Adi01nite_16440 [Actinoplanes digitatis]